MIQLRDGILGEGNDDDDDDGGSFLNYKFVSWFLPPHRFDSHHVRIDSVSLRHTLTYLRYKYG